MTSLLLPMILLGASVSEEAPDTEATPVVTARAEARARILRPARIVWQERLSGRVVETESAGASTRIRQNATETIQLIEFP
ncbi:MAG: hypothetical protein U5J78_03095 [Parasphingorhabdus sp.]|nr:hypothetical protein [Parasphingorhabdus sp.]